MLSSAIFDGDRVLARVDPAPEDRFLALNELYHPSWRAWVDGVPATVYPTNVVMRGVLVPAGASTVELRDEPFLSSAAGWGIMAFGLLLFPLLAWGLRIVDLVPRAPFLARRSPVSPAALSGTVADCADRTITALNLLTGRPLAHARRRPTMFHKRYTDGRRGDPGPRSEPSPLRDPRGTVPWTC